MNVEQMKELKIMKAIMKTMKRNIMMIVMAVAFALPAVAVEYGNKSQYAVMPPASFQSTSTMVATGSTYSSNPTLGDDGTATYNGDQGNSSNPRGVHKAPPLIVTPGQLEEGHVPLGDAVLPLLLLACAYLIMRATRTRAKKG